MAIQSMTGFGRGANQSDGGAFYAEVKSVNHRHLDVRIRLPKFLSLSETGIKAAVADVLSRGRIEISVAESEGSGGMGVAVSVDLDLAKALAQAHRELATGADVPLALDTRVLLQTPGVLQVTSKVLDEKEQLALVMPAIHQALDALKQMRAAEGRKIEEHLREILANMVSQRSRLAECAPRQSEDYRPRLEKRIRSTLGGLDVEVDQWKLLHEVGVFSEKTDVMEELSRLESHFEQVESLMARPADEPVGRRRDFLCQEMNREVNTVGSKVQDSDMLSVCLDLKAELERFREQVQNVE